MKFWCTVYNVNGYMFGEEVHGETREEAASLLFARGTGEILVDVEPRTVPYTESVLPAFDAGDYTGAAHGACQLLRLQNDPAAALAALGDHGLLHQLLHLVVMPDEPAVKYFHDEIREQLVRLESRVRPGLNR